MLAISYYTNVNRVAFTKWLLIDNAECQPDLWLKDQTKER